MEKPVSRDQASNHNIKINYDNLFFIAYAVLFLQSMLTIYSNVSDLLGDDLTDLVSTTLYIIFLLFCLVLISFRKKYSIRDFLTLVIFGVIGLLSYYFAGDHNFLDWLLIVWLAQGIDFQKFLRKVLWLTCFVSLIIVLMSCTGLISMWSKIRTESGKLRRALGFNHANTLGMVTFQIIAGYMLLKSNSKGFIKYIFMLILTFIIYRISDSQSFILVSILLLTAFFVYQIVSQNLISKNHIKTIAKVLLAAALIALAVLILYYWRNPSSLGFSTVRARINLAQKYLNAYGIKLLGQPIVQGVNVRIPGHRAGYFFLDNSQVWLLIKYGIICNIVFYIVCINMFRKIFKSGNIYMLIVACAFLLYSLMENGIYRVQFNFMFIYAGIVMFHSLAVKESREGKDINSSQHDAFIGTT